jgi:hypothetical protein
MEAVRPQVDRFLVTLLGSRTFSRREFRELPSGQVRITSALAQSVAIAALPQIERAVGLPTEEIARFIAASGSGMTVRTRLTQADRKRGRARTQSRKAERLTSACRICGLVLDDPGREICDECLPDYNAERTRQLAASGMATLASMRASPDDPARTPESLAKQRAKSRAESLAAAAWERKHGRPDPALYESDIYPRIQHMTIPELMRVTGLSQYHCWRVRKGRGRLHPRHWEGIRQESKEERDE